MGEGWKNVWGGLLATGLIIFGAALLTVAFVARLERDGRGDDSVAQKLRAEPLGAVRPPGFFVDPEGVKIVELSGRKYWAVEGREGLMYLIPKGEEK